MDAMTPTNEHAEEPLAHVIPIWVYLGVFTALMVLTAITVGVSYFDLGVLNLAVALAIATVKAMLVALFFMHLGYDSPFNGIIFAIGILCLGLFLGITLLDTVEYQPDVQTWQENRTK